MMEPDPRAPAEVVMTKPWIQGVMLLIMVGSLTGAMSVATREARLTARSGACSGRVDAP